MQFNSLEFAIFLPIVFFLYWGLPQKYRWILLLGSSYYFYMSWNVKYLALIVLITVMSYISALAIEKCQNQLAKKWIVLGNTFGAVAILVVFKYLNMIISSFAELLSMFGKSINVISFNILLPVGISFYSFQAISYVVDVYRGKGKVEYHLGKYATYIAFFPQLVAGPIERADNLLPQINRENRFDYKKATYGLKLMAWGFFKKIVIADSVAVFVNYVFADVYSFKGASLAIAAVFFTIQIYCDFSGYSDIAIGTAKLFGIDLMTNFRGPYFATSINDFWSKWHISLSSWLRDYIYIPMGGSRCSKVKHYRNLVVTFLISGIWHGAAWNFVIWGGLHGIACVLEKVIDRIKCGKCISGVKPIKVIITFFIITILWVFFRAESVNEVVYLMGHVLEGISSPVQYLLDAKYALNMSSKQILWFVLEISILFTFDYFSLKMDVIEKISNLSIIKRWVIYVMFIIILLFLTPVNANTEFIYFQF